MKAHIVGSGMAGLAAAASLIRDGGVLGRAITVYEAGRTLGGAMGMAGGPQSGFVLPTGRVFEREYRCAFELFSIVPSVSDPGQSIADEILAFNARHGYDDRLRILNGAGEAVHAPHFGLSRRNRLDLVKLALTPEHRLEGKPLTEVFTADFFETEFWVLWTTLMNALPQHSALEFRRFMYRFLHIVPELSTMRTILRTRYNQYEALVLPISTWLRDQGVTFLTDAAVVDVGFRSSPGSITANSITYRHRGLRHDVEVGDRDVVLVTNGSQVADLGVGSMAQPAPERLTDASWALWRRLSIGRPEFGRPEAFFGPSHVPDTRWCTFTVTTRDPTFFDLMTRLTGSEPGRGGLMTLRDSAWLVTVALFHQPEFLAQPEGTLVWWGFGLYPHRTGDFVGKPMTACGGAEILEETLRHAGFGDHARSIVAASTAIPCLLPYAGSVWLVRRSTDRPKAVPDGSTNFGFIGQFCEIPEEAAFTMEYAVRSARTAVAALLGLERKPPEIYRPHHDPKVLERVLETLA